MKWHRYIIIWLIGIMALVVIGVMVVPLLIQENKRAESQSHLTRLTSNIDSQISLRLQSLLIFAKNPLLIKFLQEQTEPDNPEIFALLNGIMPITRASLIYVMKRGGTVVGSSVYGDNKTLTGKNYSFRPYFQRAMEGVHVVYPALGITTNKRGIYISAPVHGDSNEILGVVVLKVGLADIDILLAEEKEPAVLVSPEGVIFASNQPDWLYKTIEPLSASVLDQFVRSKQFANESLLPLEWDLDNSSVKIENRSYETFTSPLSIAGWRIIIGRDIKSRPSLLTVQKQLLLLCFTICTVLFTIIIFLVKNINHRKKTEQQLATYNVRLETTVEERTAALDKANDTLLQKNEELKELSVRDGLTGLFNRRKLVDTLQTEYDRAKRYSSELSLVIMDLDFFKKVNDNHGHEFGDFVIREFAQRVENLIRKSDFCFRFGGEEFVVLMPQTNLKEAVCAGEKIRNYCENNIFDNGSHSMNVTVSAGASSLSLTDITIPNDLISLADKALYRAKEEGRNRVQAMATEDQSI